MFKKIFKYLIVVVFSILIAGVGIDAADHYGNIKESILGRLINGKQSGPCPDDMVFVPTENQGFCIDKYEASTGEACPNLAPTSQQETTANIDLFDCKPESKPETTPWTNLSQAQAMELCAKAGKRLPTDAEWYLASLGTPDKNDGWALDDCQVSKNWSAQPGMTGAGVNCKSSAGAYDMIGNVWEFVKAQSDDGVINGVKLPGTGFIKAVDINGLPVETDENSPDENNKKDYFWIKETGSRAMARGGYWDSKSDAGRYSVYLVTPLGTAGDGIGFRCAK